MMNPINVTHMLIIEERRVLEAERAAALERMMQENVPARANRLAGLGHWVRARIGAGKRNEGASARTHMTQAH